MRINESPDDHDFYTETNRIARELDPTRQTGGIRCHRGSELLEDVYTMNDFTHSGGELALRDQRTITRARLHRTLHRDRVQRPHVSYQAA